MKKFIINMLLVMGFLGFLECFALAKPSNDLLAYHNDIMTIAGNDAGLVVQSKYDPICIFSPLVATELDDTSDQKTYFFPRTRYADIKKAGILAQLHDQLDRFGTQVNVQQVTGKNYGIRMIFTMQPDDSYDIEKVIDSDKKTVTFNFVKKM